MKTIARLGILAALTTSLFAVAVDAQAGGRAHARGSVAKIGRAHV